MKDRGFSKLLPAALLAVLLVCAAVLRLGYINWDEFQHVHPDERFIVWTADTVRWPGDLSAALDPTSSALNPFRWPPGTNELAGKPRNYAYGHFPLYLLVIVAHAAEAVAGWFGRTTIAFPPAFQPLYTIGRHLAEYNYLALVGRAISVLADLGTLLLVYAMGRRIGEWADGEWRMANVRMANGRMSNGECRMANVRMANVRMANVRMANGRMANGRMSNGRMSNGRMGESTNQRIP
jgi:hypothetical protein